MTSFIMDVQELERCLMFSFNSFVSSERNAMNWRDKSAGNGTH